MFFRPAAAAMACALAFWPMSGAQAFRLPAGAVPLTAEEIVKLHAGSTGVYPVTDEYFAPDGTTAGTFGKPVVKSTFAGKWIAYGNTLCTLNGSSYDAKVYTDCNAFWRAGDRVLFVWSTHSDGSKADMLNGYYDVAGTLKPGNLVAGSGKAAP